MLFYAVIIAAVAAQLLLSFYPNHRTTTWFEFITDGIMPEAFANIGQDTLARMWNDGFRLGVAQGSGEVSAAIARYLETSGTKWIVEIAAGGGAAPTLWADELRNNYQSTAGHVRVLLTDLQPHQAAWKELGSYVEFVNSSVDARSMQESLANVPGFEEEWTQGSLRSIHAALHHFPPSLVRSVLEDVVKSRSAFLSGDCAPTGGGVLWNWVLSWKYISLGDPVVRAKVLAHTSRLPWWTRIIVPIMPLLGIHDATVSVMRAYSVQELTDILHSIEGGREYEVSVFNSGTFGQWLGLPIALQDLPRTGLNHPVIQYVLVQPKLQQV